MPSSFDNRNGSWAPGSAIGNDATTPRQVASVAGARRLQSSNMSAVLAPDFAERERLNSSSSRATTPRYATPNSENMAAVFTYDKFDTGNPVDMRKEKRHYNVNATSDMDQSGQALDGRTKSPARNRSDTMGRLLTNEFEETPIDPSRPLSPHDARLRNRNMSCDLTGLLQHQGQALPVTKSRRESMFDILAHKDTAAHDATGEVTPRVNITPDKYTPSNHYRTGPPPDMSPVVPDLLKHQEVETRPVDRLPIGIRTDLQRPSDSGEQKLFQARKHLPQNERSAGQLLGTDGRYTNPFGQDVRKERTRIVAGRIVTEYVD